MTKPLHRDVQTFAEKLLELEQLLEKNRAESWAEAIRKSRLAADHSDGWSVDRVLGLYGGMGSLNDLVLVAPNIENDKLHALREEVWTLANNLNR